MRDHVSKKPKPKCADMRVLVPSKCQKLVFLSSINVKKLVFCPQQVSKRCFLSSRKYQKLVFLSSASVKKLSLVLKEVSKTLLFWCQKHVFLSLASVKKLFLLLKEASKTCWVRSPPEAHGCAHAMRIASSYETGEVFGGLYAAGGDADGRTKLLLAAA